MPAEKSPEQRAIDGKAAPHGPSSDFVRFCWILGTLPRPLQGNAQYVRQLNRYFNQVLGDFGPHQTKCESKFPSPYPPSTQFNLAPARVTRLSGAKEDGCRWLLFLWCF
jgi:hypothetical protein